MPDPTASPPKPRLLLPSAITIAAVAMCLALGTWQVKRLAWKSALIADREAQLAAPPVALPADPAALAGFEFRRVTVTGRFLHQAEMPFMGRNKSGEFGYMIVTPLLRPDGSTVAVNRGWVPPDKKDPSLRPETLVEGEVTLAGIARQGYGKGPFTIPNEPAKKQWAWTDYAMMSETAGRPLLPIVIDADRDAADPRRLPRGGQTVVRLPNNHLVYAITWFSLAVAGVVIYGLWRHKALRGEGV